MTSRRRVVLIALPLALVFALWAGPGLSPDDGEHLPPVPPEVTVPPDPPAPPAEPPAPENALECEPTPDPGPDGDG